MFSSVQRAVVVFNLHVRTMLGLHLSILDFLKACGLPCGVFYVVTHGIPVAWTRFPESAIRVIRLLPVTLSKF